MVTRRGKWVSVVSIGEIERGIARKRSSDAGFATQLAEWLDQLLRLYGDRLLPVDVGVTRNQRHFTPTGVPTVNPWVGEGGS